jgi:hypothetical protein
VPDRAMVSTRVKDGLGGRVEGEDQGGQGERGACGQRARNDRASFGREM